MNNEQLKEYYENLFLRTKKVVEEHQPQSSGQLTREYIALELGYSKAYFNTFKVAGEYRGNDVIKPYVKKIIDYLDEHTPLRNERPRINKQKCIKEKEIVKPFEIKHEITIDGRRCLKVPHFLSPKEKKNLKIKTTKITI